MPLANTGNKLDSSPIYLVIDTNVIFYEWQEVLKVQNNLKRKAKIFIVTTPDIIVEIKSQLARTILKILQEGITTIAPSKISVKKSIAVAKQLGIANELSATDISLASLAYELSTKGNIAIVWTSDLKLQNLCTYLGIPVISKRKKIKYLVFRAKKCLQCSTIYPYNLKQCPNCGFYDFKRVIKKIKVMGDDLGSLIFQDPSDS